MAVRHPLAASVLALAAVIWLDLGWVTLVALVLAVVVLLAAWWWFWPGSFSRRVGRPARGKWRTWCYRRRWAAVMTIAGAAPCYQDRILLPVLGKVAATRYTDRVQVRLVSGQSVTDFAACAENLAHGFGAMLCRVRTAKPGAVVLEFIRRDALAVLVPAQPIPARPGSDGAAGRPPRRRAALARRTPRHPRADRGRDRGGEGLAAVGAGPGHVPADADRPGQGPGRRPEADGAGLRPGHLRVPRRLRRRPRLDRRPARPGGRRHAGPGPPVRRTPARPHPHPDRPVHRGPGR